MAVDEVDHVGDELLGERAVDDAEGQHRVDRQQRRDHHPARRRGQPLHEGATLGINRLAAGGDLGVHRQRAALQRLFDLTHIADARRGRIIGGAVIRRLQREVVNAKHNVLARHDDRLAVCRAEDVVGRHHQHARFQLGFQRERHVHGHLVAVEIGVEGGADQRVKLNGLALNQHRLEGLNAEAVQRRRAVEHHRVFADHLFEDIPHLGALLLHHPLGGLDGGGVAVFFQLGIDEGLEQLQGHLLRQAALMQLQFRAHHNDRTARVIDALAQQVLPEAPLLALEHIGKRLQRALIGTRDGPAAATIVEQRIDRFLQHALFVAHDDIRRAQLDQPLQAVVAVDDAAIEIIQIRGGKPAAIERHQRAQFGRNDRDDVQDHPFRPGAAFIEGIDQLEALDQLLALGLAARLAQISAQAHALLRQIDAGQNQLHRLSANADREGVIAKLIQLGLVLVLIEQLVQLEVGQAGLEHHIALEIEDLLKVLQRHIDHKADAAGQALHEPDMGHGAGQLDMAHALAPDLGQRDFHAAFLADNAAELHPLILAAKALVILDRPKDSGAEQPVPLRLEGAVVDRFRLFDLAIGPGANLLRRRHGDLDLVESDGLARLAQDLHQLIHATQLSILHARKDAPRAVKDTLDEIRGGEITPPRFPDRRSGPGSSVPSPAH